VHASANAALLAGSSSEKRQRDEEGDRRPVKKEKAADGSDDEEMEIEDDEEGEAGGASGAFAMSCPYNRLSHSSAVPAAVERPTARLLCTNLPMEVTDDVLSLLFKQYVLVIFHVQTHFTSVKIPGLQDHSGCAFTKP
jgi:hypothetical protein